LQAINALPTQTPMQNSTTELKDIHVPEQISNSPIAYGWWLLAIVLMIIVVITFLKVRKKIKLNKVRKQALVQLKNNPDASTSDIIALLKWAAMHYFSRIELAKLFGNSLQSFLTEKLPIKYQENFTSLSNKTFINQYQAQNSDNIEQQFDTDFHKAAILWLTHALPPKILKTTKQSTSSIDNESRGVNV
jgi:hypothetical protein